VRALRRASAMSKLERPAGLAIMEKLMGLLLIVVGALAIYYSSSAMNVLGGSCVLFITLGVVLLLVGIALLIAKAE